MKEPPEVGVILDKKLNKKFKLFKMSMIKVVVLSVLQLHNAKIQ